MLSKAVFAGMSCLLASMAHASPAPSGTGSGAPATTVRLADVQAALSTVALPKPDPTNAPIPGPQSNATMLLSQPHVQGAVDAGLALLPALLRNDTVPGTSTVKHVPRGDSIIARVCTLQDMECEIGGCITPPPSGIQASPAAVAFVAQAMCNFWFPGDTQFLLEGTSGISPSIARLVLEYHVRPGCNTCNPPVSSFFSMTHQQCTAAFATMVSFANASPPSSSCAGDMQGVSTQGKCDPIWFHWYTE